MFAINNMLGAVIKVKTGLQAIKVYKHLQTQKTLKLVKIYNWLDNPLKNLTLNFIYLNHIIVEVVIQCGELPVNYKSN